MTIVVGPHSYHPLKSGRGLVLELPSGELIFSTHEICRLSRDSSASSDGGRGLVDIESPEQRATVDYWLEWECSQLKVCVCVCVSTNI